MTFDLLPLNNPIGTFQANTNDWEVGRNRFLIFFCTIILRQLKAEPLQFGGYQTHRPTGTQMMQPWVGFMSNFRVKKVMCFQPIKYSNL